MKWLLFLLTPMFLLTACGNMDFVTAAPNPFVVTPSRPPTIFTLTPAIPAYPTTSATLPPPPSPTFSPTAAQEVTITPTITETLTVTPTATSSAPLSIQVLGCETGLDVTHGMGEVTNGYVTLANASGPDLTTVCATLSAADEGRVHPEKTICVSSLPRGYQVALKLTIDTTFKVDTVVHVAVVSSEGILASAGGQSCRAIGASKPAQEVIGVLQPIP